MSKLLKILLVISFLFTLNNCSKDNPVEPESKYSGITHTGEGGPEPIGEVDPDDWFYGNDSTISGISIPAGYCVWPAYPNPTARYTTIKIALTRQDSVKVWIDDPMSNKKTVIVNRNLLAGVHEFLVDLNYGDDNFVRKTGIVRVFFDFFSISDIPLIHGDIQIIK